MVISEDGQEIYEIDSELRGKIMKDHKYKETSRSRGWCYTINNPDEQDGLAIEFMCANGHAKYAIYGRETGYEGTEHFQGYIQFGTVKSFKQVKRFMPRAHWEKARGSPYANYMYCSKDGDIQEWGTRPVSNKENGQKEKDRWLSIWEKAKNGDIELIEPQVKVQYYGSLRAISKDYMRKAADAVRETGVWIWGKTGVGKSRKAREDYPNAYLKMCNKWWDGYQGEDTVIMDDVDPDNAVWLCYYLKIWCDRYSFLAEIKGGAMQIRPKWFVVTSQYTIEACFRDKPEAIKALRRRCKVIHLDKPFEDVDIVEDEYGLNGCGVLIDGVFNTWFGHEDEFKHG